MALGLGQNWTRVRRVIHMGRGDPSCIEQMLGRCGRDGRPGLGVLLVEEKRRGGKNEIKDFDLSKPQSDDDRMDALAITPVCLRVALCIDNKKGYIPLMIDDPAVLEEQNRQVSVGMPACRCSNCDPALAEMLIKNQKYSTSENFDDVLVMKDMILSSQKSSDQPSDSNTNSSALIDPALSHPQLVDLTNSDTSATKFECPEEDSIRTDTAMLALFNLIVRSFNQMFNDQYGTNSDLTPKLLLKHKKIWLLTKNYSQLLNGLHIRSILGTEPIVGTFEMIYRSIHLWKHSDIYQIHKTRLDCTVDLWLKAVKDKEEKARKRKEREKAKPQKKHIKISSKPQKQKKEANISAKNKKRDISTSGRDERLNTIPTPSTSVPDLLRQAKKPRKLPNTQKIDGVRAELSQPRKPNFDNNLSGCHPPNQNHQLPQLPT
ncbi:uncharacterized protein MELLADRAFT_87874 [Melampsora larici-populina 98AG31]|uniref:Helicase C-terminal domain-containing protein n=1 Tax=Melampsora larici-populina (strain 98AG31 / pathotype 3-4-7) TaxID=747676 RepID=F4RPU4_MELLP|nr:uncharacterized protein MELLADRAFT_87874 [Melampsora larici-populina 98AG31]EGG05678.1 hypothetical protein MELLADRAFT_87874 [Melampsora larici-populina 98AG31]